MKNINKIAIYFTVLIIIAALLSCADSESRLKPVPSGKTSVIISLGLPPENPTAKDDSIWNSIRRIFAPDAVAQTAPAVFSAISVTVTGPDISPIRQNFFPAPTITLDVPAGDIRRFEVTAAVAPGDPNAALSYRGIATTNLPEGQTVSIPVLMVPNEIRMLVPDFLNYRIAVMDDMSGAGWSIIDGPQLGLDLIQPWDLDFDSRGRIYIADRLNNGIIRIDNIKGGNRINFAPVNQNEGALTAVAVDRINNRLYYATSYSLFQSNLDGSDMQPKLIPVSESISSVTINGIDVAPDGMLYIAAIVFFHNESSGPAIFKYDPSGSGAIVGRYDDGNVLAAPSDVMAAGQFVYVANASGGVNNKILQLSVDSNNIFTLVNNYGSPTSTGTDETKVPGLFYGPKHFIFGGNNKLIMIDEGSFFSSDFPFLVDRLVSIQDIQGNGWTTFGQSGTETDMFNFYDTITF